MSFAIGMNRWCGPRCRALVLVMAVLLVQATAAAAQVMETPVAFDRDGRIMAITPSLAARLGLESPAWPVSGDFRQARLYSTGDAHVLVVERGSGVVERYPWSDQQLESLRVNLDAAVDRAGRPLGEERPDLMPSMPARGEFARNQTSIAAVLYGPAVATLIGDPALASAAYLVVTGGTFFYTYSQSRHSSITRAQNHFSTDLALRGALAANLLLIGGDIENENVSAAAALAGGIGGTLAGISLGRPLTEAEVNAATYGSTALGLTTLGVLGTAGMLNDDFTGVAPLAIVGALGAGLPLGLTYARRAAYTVTAGDVSTLGGSGALGALAALTVMPDNANMNTGSAMVTAGFLAGLAAGDRLIVRPFDYTRGESALLGLGTFAGGAVGLGLSMAADVESWRAVLGAITLGGIGGALATHNLLDPSPGAVRPAARGTPGGSPGAGAQLRFTPANAALAAAGVEGRHSLLSISF